MTKEEAISTFKRNVCKECDYYCSENNVCQSKKCETCGIHPYVNWFDRHFCQPYKRKVRMRNET